MNDTLKIRYEDRYACDVAAFLSEVSDIDAKGIPDPHLPLWGADYETTALRIAFIGQDTYGWGRMADFRAAGRSRVQDCLSMHEDVFRDLLFTGWTNNFGSTFWDTVMQLLAVLHDIPDWKQLKRRERDDILQTFMWAQTNSVELWGSTPSGAGANYEDWQKFKAASERHLDSFAKILDVFQPHLAIVLNWTVRDEYWDYPLEWHRIGDHVDYAFDPVHSTHVFHIAHATWLRGERRSNTLQTISIQWKSVFKSQ